MLGAFLLIYYGNQFLDHVQRTGGTLHKINYILLAKVAYGLVLGGYLAIFDGWPSRRKFHKPIFLVVFLPSLLLLLYPIINIYIEMPYASWYQQTAKWNGQFWFGVLAGLSLLKGLFGNK
ncbi:hypothetical protein D3C77_373340 [compost metagenome]